MFLEMDETEWQQIEVLIDDLNNDIWGRNSSDEKSDIIENALIDHNIVTEQSNISNEESSEYGF